MPSPNPLLRLLDIVTEIPFYRGNGRQHQEDAPVMENMDGSDDRRAHKRYVRSKFCQTPISIA